MSIAMKGDFIEGYSTMFDGELRQMRQESCGITKVLHTGGHNYGSSLRKSR